MKKLISLCIIALLSTNILFAHAQIDNEIKIEQEGDTLKLYIDQIGFGNKVGGDRCKWWFTVKYGNHW